MGDYPAGTTCEDVMKSAFARAFEVGAQLEELHRAMDADGARMYSHLTDEFVALGGYGWETELNKVASGLGSTPKCARGAMTRSPAGSARACASRS